MTSSKMSSYSQHGSTWNVAELPLMPRARTESTGLQFRSSVYSQSTTISVLVVSPRTLSLSANRPCIGGPASISQVGSGGVSSPAHYLPTATVSTQVQSGSSSPLLSSALSVPAPSPTSLRHVRARNAGRRGSLSRTTRSA